MKPIMKLCFVFLLLMFAMPVLAAGDGSFISWKKEVFKVVNSLIFFGGLAYILKKPVAEFFAGRRKDIKHNLELAETSVEEANEQLEKIAAKMANLDDELQEINESAKQDLENERLRMKEQAQAEAERIIEQAKTECENMRREGIQNLKAYLADLAVKQAEVMIKDKMTDAERDRLFTDFNEKLGASS